jgi:hypothetical protein
MKHGFLIALLAFGISTPIAWADGVEFEGAPRSGFSAYQAADRDAINLLIRSDGKPTLVRYAEECCKICTKGKACGNSCINRNYQCHQPPGCACDG